MATFIPHTADDVRTMLDRLGLEDAAGLFSSVPREVLSSGRLDIPPGISEYETMRRLEDLASQNETGLVSFLGCGIYDHIVPAAINPIISRGEFLTSYTPYQAEISQGMLQAIYEFQSMICGLTALDVSNASLYDGHTAAAEAAVIALNALPKRDRILYSAGLHPHTKQVLATSFYDTDVRLEEVPLRDGAFDRAALESMLDESTAAFIVSSPNIYGISEDLTGAEEMLHANRSLFIISCNPVSLGLLKPPGEWGADIACGELQPFGLAMNYGGPGAGFLSARKEHLRRMPGRIAGRTVDSMGRRTFVLTLQAREQHIKRARATSNICSNQALAAVATTIYMALVGGGGLRELALQNASKAAYLAERMVRLRGVRLLYEKPFFNEFTVELPVTASSFIEELSGCGFLAGADTDALIRRAEGGRLLTVAVTEKRTKAEMDAFIEAASECLGGCNG